VPKDAAARRHTAILCLLLVAATLGFYNPIVRNHFIAFDDSPYIVANPPVQHGLTWGTVRWSFTTFHAGYWHPVTWLSHALDCQIFHLNPAGHHYTNLLLHAINAVLLFLLLRNATGLTAPSFAVSALFALHPVNVESVAWAAERKNVLSMLFFVLAMHAYDRYARTNKKTSYVAVAVCFALGLMAKPQIVTLPFVLLLWDYWPLERMQIGVGGQRSESSPFKARPFTLLLREKVPLFILAAADSVVIVLAQRYGNAVRTAAEVPYPVRIENSLVSYVRYLGIAFWPSRLAPMYPRSAILLPISHVAGALAVLAIVSLVVLRFRQRRYLIVGWLWFLGTLVPMIGLVTVGEQAMADRFAYLPFIGLFIAVVWTVNAMRAQGRTANAVTAGCSAGVVLILGCLTYRQVGYWHDDESLWRYTLRVTNNNYMAHTNLAFTLAESGRAAEAIANFRSARALHRYPADQIVELAFYELRMGYPREALDECRAALDASSDPKIRQVVLGAMGHAFVELKQYQDADKSYTEILRLSPDNADALVNSGLLALRSANFNLAIQRFTRASQIDPSDVNFLLLGQALQRSGRIFDADGAFAKARQVATDFKQSQRTADQMLAQAEIKPL
jgi:protein O-mannosyl-transferase